MSKLNDEQLRVLTLILREPQEESSTPDNAVRLSRAQPESDFDSSHQFANQSLAGR